MREIKFNIEDFIAECNTTQITDDGGNSFNSSFTYLVEKLELALTNSTTLEIKQLRK